MEESNAGFKWAWDENSLVHKFVGVVLGEEEYRKKDGAIGTKLVVKDIKTINQILKGEFKIPATKKLAEAASYVTAPNLVELPNDEPLPF